MWHSRANVRPSSVRNVVRSTVSTTRGFARCGSRAAARVFVPLSSSKTTAIANGSASVNPSRAVRCRSVRECCHRPHELLPQRSALVIDSHSSQGTGVSSTIAQGSNVNSGVRSKTMAAASRSAKLLNSAAGVTFPRPCTAPPSHDAGEKLREVRGEGEGDVGLRAKRHQRVQTRILLRHANKGERCSLILHGAYRRPEAGISQPVFSVDVPCVGSSTYKVARCSGEHRS
jgi:hypothetical protein